MRFQKVMKFGGGCLRDADGFRRAAEIILNESLPPIAVVSAVSGVTDALEQGLARAVKNEAGVVRTIRILRSRHEDLAASLLPPEGILKETLDQNGIRLHRLEKLLRGAALTGEASPCTRAHILSFGERWAAILLAAVLRAKGIDARAMESETIGLAAEETADEASADLPAFRRAAVRNALGLEAGRFVPVITGFYGVTPKRKIASFGRNGSDYSAAVIAAGLRVRILEIWKDVDGFMTADPKWIPAAKSIARLSFVEAAELAYFGAKVLHPRTLEPLAGENVTIRIRHLDHPDRPGTEICPEGQTTERVLKSVTLNNRIAVLRVQGAGVGRRPGIIGLIGQRLADRGVNILSVITAQTTINLLIAEADARVALTALKTIRRGVIARVELETDLALVAAVGEGIPAAKGLAGRMFTAVSEAGINVEMISSGASPVATYFLVRKADALTAVRALHAEFFEAAL